MKRRLFLFSLLSLLMGGATLQVTAQTTRRVADNMADYSKLYADVNGDKQMETLIVADRDDHDKRCWYWQDLDGNNVMTVAEGRGANGLGYILFGSQGQLIADYNNDGIPDVFFFEGYYDDSSPVYVYIALSNGNGDGYTMKQIDFKLGEDWDKTVKLMVEYAITVDLNRDGRLDIFGMEKNGSTYTPVTYIQTADHNFQRQELNVVTDPEEIAKAQFSTGGSGSYTTSGRFISSAVSSNGRTYAAKEVVSWQAIDINMDGYPDLIDPSGHSFLSLPDGRYYAADLSGSATVADLNGDGVHDLVLFGNDKAIVLISQKNGTYKTVELLENSNITAVHCHDLDGDGISDVLVCIDTPRNGDKAYLAFFRNQGDGTFKRTVQTFDGYYYFSKLYHLKKDNCPTLIAMHAESGNGYGKKSRRFDWDKSFAVSESDLLPDDFSIEGDNPQTTYWVREINGLPLILNYLGDGSMGVLCRNSYSQNFIYQYDIDNTAPQQLAAPTVIPDKQTATVKLEWKTGKDDLTAKSDLTYDVEISSVDGQLLHSNTQHTYLIADAGSWPLGNLSARVRAVDANGYQGAWSAATSWQNTIQNGLFTMNYNEMSTADTLVVKSLSGADITFNLSPDGTIVKKEGATTYIIFYTPGQKTIEASVAGGVSVSKKVMVNPLKPFNQDMSGAYMFDLNQNGQAEGLLEKIYTKEEDDWKEYVSIDLSDVVIYTMHMFTDFNMDGLPDIRSRIDRGDNTYAWLINKGDMEFKIGSDFKDTEGNTLEGRYSSQYYQSGDFDNDGLTDFAIIPNSYGGYIYRNLGNGTYEKKIKVNSDIGTIADFDRDGLLDFLCKGWGNSIAILYHNKGNWQFEEIQLPGAVYSKVSTVDINGDGYPDITSYSEIRKGDYYCAMLGGKDLQFREIDYQGVANPIDWDNDGKPEFVNQIYGTRDTLLISNHGQVCKQVLYTNDGGIELSLNWLCDRTGDGRPDNFGSYLGYSFSFTSRYCNTAPTAPTKIYATQQDDQVIINWSGASDKETPLTGLRYNISIKEKGATGEGSYIWSPLNMTSDVAATCPTGAHHYRFATTLPMPLSRFTAGKTYEIRIQTIDNWYAHSAFSQVYEFTPSATALINLPAKGGVDTPVSYSLTNNNSSTPTIDADGGVVENGTITWSTAGVKTVTVTAGSVTNKTQIEIIEKPVLTLAVPAKVLAGQQLKVALSETLARENAMVSITGAEGGVVVDYDMAENTLLLTMPEKNGVQEITVTYEDDIFGKLTETSQVTIVGVDWKPTMKMVGVSNGKNKLTWFADQQLPDASIFNNKVNIYRETSVSDEFKLIGEANISDGQFVDATSNPDIKVSRYYITLQTTYNVESQPSVVHGNIHLMVNRGQGNDINLHWTPYEGAKIVQYTILAGTSIENLQEIEQLSGYAQSFTHKRSSDATTYYALAYTIQNTASGSRRASASETGESNIISSDEAYNITPVESIQISAKEETLVLNETQEQLHLQAVVTPALATLTNVEWSIKSGEEFAEISSDGVMTATKNEKVGKVTVQARAVDGSDVTAEIVIDVEAFTAAFIPGDANGDGLVNVTDIVEIVNSILGHPSAKFNKTAADVNGDGEVNVTDIVSVVNIILSSNARELTNRAAATNNLKLSGGSIKLRNAENYTAAQFDIHLTDGSTVNHLSLNSASDHQMTWKMVDANTYRVVVYSMTNAAFRANSDNLFTVFMTGVQNATISNELLIKAEGATGIDAIRRETENGKVYDLNGRQVKNPRKGVYIINGRKVVVK